MAIFDYDPKAVGMLPYWKWNRVLPAVYDDSLSQYEILCKLLYKVNDIITNSNSMGEQVEQLTQLVQQLIDGQFPSGIVDYVNDIVEAAMAEDIEAMYAAIAAIETTVNSRIEASSVDNGTLQAIWRVVRSYLINSDKLAFSTYSEGHNAWSYDTGPWQIVDAYGHNGYAINCSAFVHLVLTGTTFERSMYNRENGNFNYFGGEGYCFNMYGEAVNAGNFEQYQFVRDFAPRLAEMGLTEMIASDFSNIRAGDVLLFSNQENKTYETATHTGIVLAGPYGHYTSDSGRGQYLVAEAFGGANFIRVAPITCEALITRGVFATAHIPYQAVPLAENNLIADCPRVSGHIDIVPNNMVVGDIITIECDCETTDTSQYLTVRVNDNEVITPNPLRYATTPLNNGCVGTKHVVITIPTLYTITNVTTINLPINKLQIYCVNGCYAYNLKVYVGYGNNGHEYATTLTSRADILSLLNEYANLYSVGYHVIDISHYFINGTITIDSYTLSSGNVLLKGLMKIEKTIDTVRFTGELITGSVTLTVTYSLVNGVESLVISE